MLLAHELGLKSIYICPDLNYGAAVHADKWIPILPNTDAALQLAIAYVWITEGTYDKEYIATHSYGFEKFEDYVLGKEDGVPKTPAWASEKCGVPEWTIKALARDWAKKTTSLIHGNGGPGISGPYLLRAGPAGSHAPGHERPGQARRPSGQDDRMVDLGRVVSLPYQGKIRPNLAGFSEQVRPVELHGSDADDPAPLLGRPSGDAGTDQAHRPDSARRPSPSASSTTPSCTRPSAGGACTASWSRRKSSSSEHTYPAPGCSEVHMIWTDSPCWITCWNDSNTYIQALQSPSIECIVAQHPWLENDCLMADIILPVSTRFEMLDIGNDLGSGVLTSVFVEEPCIDPVGESLSDFDVVARIAEKLGLWEEYTLGKTMEEKQKLAFDASGHGRAGLLGGAEGEAVLRHPLQRRGQGPATRPAASSPTTRPTIP